MLKIGIHHNIGNPRLNYTIDFLKRHPLLLEHDIYLSVNNITGDNDINISYGEDSGAANTDYNIPSQNLFFRQKNRIPTHSIYANEYAHLGKKVRSVEKEKNTETLLFLKKKSFSLTF